MSVFEPKFIQYHDYNKDDFDKSEIDETSMISNGVRYKMVLAVRNDEIFLLEMYKEHLQGFHFKNRTFDRE